MGVVTDDYAKATMGKEEFYRKTLASDRKRLQALTDKLQKAREDRNIVRMASLADTAATIARRYEIMLCNLLLSKEKAT